MSRLALAQPAVREKMPAKLMISAPEGGGKTETALRMARAFAGPNGDILFVDTERRKALLYADDHTFVHIPWSAPYDPDELADDLIAGGDQYAVIVVDSVYSFWSDKGGVRDIADSNAPRGNGFAGWKAARPAHRRMVDAIIDSRAHVILCCRAKVDYVQEVNPTTGRTQVRSLGMQPMTDDFLPSEVDVHLRMDPDDHAITVAKSRIKTIPQGTVYPGSDAETVAVTYREWCKGGVPLAAPEVVAEIEARMKAITDPDERMDAKRHFVAHLGRPRYLRATQVDDALSMVARFEQSAAGSIQAAAPPAPVRHPGGTATPAAQAVKLDEAGLEAWLRLARQLPRALGDAAAAEYSRAPRTTADRDRMVAEIRSRYLAAHGGARRWDADELAEAQRLIAELRGLPQEWDTFVEVAFENFADADHPENWTDDQYLKLKTWIRIGSTPPSSTESTDADDNRTPVPA